MDVEAGGLRGPDSRGQAAHFPERSCRCVQVDKNPGLRSGRQVT